MCHLHIRVIMENEADSNKKKFTWVIKNFSTLQSKAVYSDQFVARGCKWRLVAYPKGSKSSNSLSLVLKVGDSVTLPCGGRRQAKYRLTIVNQSSEKLSLYKESEQWFDQKCLAWGYASMLPLSKLYAIDGGFLVNDEVKIVAEVEVVEVIGGLDVLEESGEVTQPLKKVKREDNMESQDLVNEIMDVIGDLPFQVEFFSRVLKKYPDIALVLRAKNHYLRKACMLVFHSLTETLCKSLEELSNDDIVEAENSLTYLKLSGFKVDWLEKKLEEVKERKKEKQIGETRIHELEGGLKDFRQKCSEIEALLEEKKKELEELKQKCSEIETLLEKEKAKEATETCVEIGKLPQFCKEVVGLVKRSQLGVCKARRFSE